MSLSVKHYHSGSWVDISDYVIGADPVPYISRNRDWTLRADTWTVNIAATIRKDASYNSDTFKFLADDRFAVWDATKLLFVGYVKKAPLDYATMVFNVETVSDIQKTDNYKIDYATLHAALIAGSPTQYEYRAQSYYVMPTVHYLYLMKKMFSIAGLTLDTSAIDNVVAFHYIYDATYNADVKYRDLFVGESELYCLNQSADAYHTIIDNTLYDYNKDKITFFELLKELCGILSIAIVPTAIDNYKLILATSNYSIADDDKYEYASEDVSADEELANLGLSIQSLDYTKVLSGSANSNMQTTSMGSGSGLSWLSKLRINFIYEIIIYDAAKVVAISAASWSSDTLHITTATAHGLSLGGTFMIFGMAGMSEPNKHIYDVSNYVATLPTAGVEIYTSFSPQPGTYIEGGWIYKDNGTNYVNSYRWATLSPQEISINTTIPSTGEINVLLNQVKTKSSNYTKETITCPKQTTDATVVENFIDLENRTSHIIQETY